jgi:hypothetical protein
MKKRRPKSAVPEENPLAAAADAATILQVKFWLTGISPMVWRRVLVPSSFTLRELHGVIQVATGWEGIHLYEFELRAAHCVWLRSICDVRVIRRVRPGRKFVGITGLPAGPGARRRLCVA